MEATLNQTLDKISGSLDLLKSDHLGIVNGKLGALIFFAYSSLNKTEKTDRKKAKNLLAEILADLETEQEIDLSYAAGITGLLSVFAHFKNEKELDFFKAVHVNDIHEHIFLQAKKWIACDFIDNLYGAVGIIHYFNQLDGEVQQLYTCELIRLLIDRAIDIDFSKIAFINSFPNKENQSFDFGFAHGMSGMLSVFLDVYEKQQCKELLHPIITKCIHYILESKISLEAEYSQYSLFPSTYNQYTREYTINNRLAWCYGDLNQVLLFYKAGDILQKKEYTQYASIFGMATLSRKTEESTEIYNSTFCHGASGLAFIYLKLYTLSKEDAYLKAHDFWIAETIRLLNLELDNNIYKQEDASSMLDGLVGTALVLLSSLSIKNSTWSKFLFI